MQRPSAHLACVLAMIVVAAPGSVLCGPKQKAKASFARASKALREGKLDEALADLQAAYKLDPRPDLLYAIGQVNVKLGKCSEAGVYYGRFLATNKDPDMASLVKQALEACAPPPPPPQPEPPPTPTPVADPEPPPPPPPPSRVEPPPLPPPVVTRPNIAPPSHQPVTVEHRSWYTDKLGDALVVAGVATAVVGFVIYRSAVSDLDAAESASSLDRYTELTDNAHSKRTYSVVLTGGGIALAGAGILHYMLGHRNTESRSVGVVPAHGGGLVTWTRGF